MLRAAVPKGTSAAGQAGDKDPGLAHILGREGDGEPFLPFARGKSSVKLLCPPWRCDDVDAATGKPQKASWPIGDAALPCPRWLHYSLGGGLAFHTGTAAHPITSDAPSPSAPAMRLHLSHATPRRSPFSWLPGGSACCARNWISAAAAKPTLVRFGPRKWPAPEEEPGPAPISSRWGTKNTPD